ncbi:S9 family peptidase [Phenylobacterium sp. J367]|uniref:alpha/beta hydrolase family protein n=1 Tax=Phenylobacterium sp. J367 TaxID=2898435 RepID=UPI002150FDF7|nr:prolyl oligopeptidase family serine peptidase [Phenylobacterium sp. J367]MCR5879457.1 prolyl oligopeptidase family serine peptidase [Phenylobacterium sp. J367]
MIVPYLGRRHAAPPAAADWRSPGPIQAPPLLATAGYAVLIPSLPIPAGAEDPAAGVADRMLAIVDQIAKDPEFQKVVAPDRVALWGASYGGYTVLSAITQTGRFRGALALAAPSELISKHGEFHPQWRVDPAAGIEAAMSMGWVETDQGAMKTPPWSDPDRYVRNSPALQAGKIKTPLLLLHGDQDNILHTQAETMFTALYRQGKDVQLVTYWGEGHAIRSPGNLRDLYERAFRFLAEVMGRDEGLSSRATVGALP